MKYLVVGGAGFIGSNFCKRLNKEDYIIYDIMKPNGNPSDELINKRLSGINKPIVDNEKILGIEFDTVIHFGSHCSIRSNMLSSEYKINNIIDYNHLLSIVSFKKIVYISTTAIFGDVKSAYSHSKEVCEEITREHKNHLIIRPSTVYGENGRPDMLIPRCINQIGKKINKPIIINGDPSKIKRVFSYVGDLIDNICRLIKCDKTGSYNDLSGSEYSISDVLSITNAKYISREAHKMDYKTLNLDESLKLWGHTRLEDYYNKVTEKLNV